MAAVTGSTRLGGKGIVKYGRKGEYVLHVGVDEDVSAGGWGYADATSTERPLSCFFLYQLFPGKPVGIETSRDRFKAKMKEATGSAATTLKQVKNDAADAAGKGLREGARLTAEMRETKRREAREEGWRSSAFDI